MTNPIIKKYINNNNNNNKDNNNEDNNSNTYKKKKKKKKSKHIYIHLIAIKINKKNIYIMNNYLNNISLINNE